MSKVTLETKVTLDKVEHKIHPNVHACTCNYLLELSIYNPNMKPRIQLIILKRVIKNSENLSKAPWFGVYDENSLI